MAALIVARNPALRWDEVKDLMKRACDKIDKTGGNYDADGHSKLYGYGRINAKTAVTLAAPTVVAPAVIHTSVKLVPIRDLKTSRISVAVPEKELVKSIKISVDIEHTYIGDLVVRVKPPATTGVTTVVLHNRAGGGKNNLRQTYDMINTPELKALAGKNSQGRWTLIVQDKEKLDTGRILKFSVELSF